MSAVILRQRLAVLADIRDVVDTGCQPRIGRLRDAAAARTQLDQVLAEREALRRSLSWRLTGPLRVVGRLPPVRRARRLVGLTLRGKLGEHRRAMARRRADADALRATPLFDAARYSQLNPHLTAAGHDPASHFAWVGAGAGAQPNPYFDTAWYLARNPAVAVSGENPLLHWLRVGAAEGLDPNAFLDVDWYSARHGVAATGLDPITHYVRHGAPAGHNPNPGLDAAAYMEETPDLGGLTPLLHWWRVGAGTARNPGPLFDAAWYRARHGLGAADPLEHWLDTDRTGPTSALMLAGGRQPIRFADAADPDVSIIIPAYGHLADTLRCLYSVMACSGDTLRYEVIVADDKPAAPITSLLAQRTDGVRLIENPENLGFLRSCNAAARQARGRHLLFLNNDTTVHPDWLAPLVRLADADPQVGMVGAKLLNTDGTLQEAGGAILPSAGDRAGDRPGGEGLRAFLGDLRVDATGDGVPHELGQPWGGPERVKHRDRTRQPIASTSTSTAAASASAASLDERALAPAGGEEQVIEFRQGRHRRSWVGEQRRGQHVQGLARALLTEHPGGAVIRAPQLDATRDHRSAQAPADVGRLERHLAPFLVPWGRCRSGRMIALLDRSRLKPRTCSASARVAIPRRASPGRW